MPDVYISYAPADRKRGEALAAALTEAGLSVGQATPNASAQEIKAELAASGAAIVCWSRAAARSAQAEAVAAQAFNHGKLISALLQDVEPAHPYQLVDSLDISDWKGGAHDPALSGLLRVVQGIAMRDPAARAAREQQAAPATPPPEIEKPAEKAAKLFKRRAPEEAPAYEPEPAAEGGRARLAVISLSAMALLVAGLWAAPRVIDALNKVSAKAQHAQVHTAARDDLPPAPNYGGAPVKAAPASDEEDAAPPTSFPAQEINTPIVTPVGAPAQMGKDSEKTVAPLVQSTRPPVASASTVVAAVKPVPAPVVASAKPAAPVAPSAKPALSSAKPAASSAKPAAPPALASAKPAASSALGAADPIAMMRSSLESCVAALAKQCTHVDPALAGQFKADGKPSLGERRLLSASPFPDSGKITNDNLTACKALSGPAALSKVCPSIAASAKPASSAPAKPAASSAKPAESAPPAHSATPPG